MAILYQLALLGITKFKYFSVINIFSFRYKTIIIAIIFTSLVSLSMISEVDFWN